MQNGAEKILTCAACGKTVKVRKRLPAGWKRRGEEIFCRNCWRGRYILRAVTFQVASPIDSTWKELREALHRMWAQTTSCSNWMVTQLAMQDVPRLPGDAKIGPMPRTYLYPAARGLFPDLTPQSVSSLEQAVTRKYRARRLDVMWKHSASLPTYRYPQPLPVHNQSWQPELDQAPIVSVRIGEGRFRLRLKGGARYRRQLAAFTQMVSGEAVTGELALYQPGDELMAKLVAWIPRQAGERATEGVLPVRTASDALLIAVNVKDERIWSYHAEHVRRWVAEHRQRLRAWSDDSKAEQRPTPAFADRRTAAAQKYRHRMQTACYQAAAYVAGYAVRRRFASVRYDDRERSWCAEFPWETLRSRLATVLDERGITFEISNLQSPIDEGI